MMETENDMHIIRETRFFVWRRMWKRFQILNLTYHILLVLQLMLAVYKF